MSTIRETVFQIGVDNKKALDGIMQLNGRLGKIETRFDSIHNKAWNLGSTLKTAFIGIGAIQVTKEMMNFENSILDAKYAIDGLMDKQTLQEFMKDMIQLSTKLPFSANALTQMAVELGKNGVALSDMRGVMDTVLKSSIAFDMSTEDSSNALAKIRNNFHLNNEALAKYAALISLAADKSNAKESQLLEVLTRIGSTATGLGLLKEETLGLATAMVNLGIEPERATTALQNLLSVAVRVKKPTETLMQAIQRMLGEIDNISNDKTRLATLEKLFGKGLEGMNVDKLRNYFAELKKGNKSMVDLFTVIKNGQKEADQLFNDKYQEKLNTTSARFQILKNTLLALALNIGDIVLPTLQTLFDFIGRLVYGFSELSTLDKWILGFGASILFLIPKLESLFGMFRIARVMYKNFLKLKASEFAIEAAIALLKGKYAAVAAAGVAIGAAAVGYGVYKMWDNGSDFKDTIPNNMPTDTINNQSNNAQTVNNYIDYKQNINGAGNPQSVGNAASQSFNDFFPLAFAK